MTLLHFLNRHFRSSDSINISCLVILSKQCFVYVESVIVYHFSFGDMLYELLCEYLQTFFCCLSSHTLDYLRGSSCQQWVLIHESIQPYPLQIPCRLSRPIQSPIDFVSFQQYHFLGHWISLTLHPNDPINQVRLHLKRQNRISSKGLFSNVLPLSQCPPR